MSAGVGKCSKIQYIVRLRQMLRRWRAKASAAARNNAFRIPADVPAGHVAVCVGANSRRFVVRAAHLNHPLFKKLLAQAEEEYGFGGNPGPLAIPCDESLFEEVLRFLTRSESGIAEELKIRCCSERSRRKGECWLESRPLLQGMAEKSVWW